MRQQRRRARHSELAEQPFVDVGGARNADNDPGVWSSQSHRRMLSCVRPVRPFLTCYVSPSKGFWLFFWKLIKYEGAKNERENRALKRGQKMAHARKAHHRGQPTNHSEPMKAATDGLQESHRMPEVEQMKRASFKLCESPTVAYLVEPLAAHYGSHCMRINIDSINVHGSSFSSASVAWRRPSRVILTGRS